MNVDPLAEKYSSISPYVYVANNPIYYIDPDGERVWVYYQNADGIEQRGEYKENQLYSSDGNIIETKNNNFLSNILKSLNSMYSTKNGAMVLQYLMKSESDFYLKNQGTGKANRVAFFANKNNENKYIGGGVLALGGAQDLETVSHELFHAYQYEKIGDGYSINSEVEAYLFSVGVGMEYAFKNNEMSGGITGRQNVEGKLFQNAMYDMLYADKFNIGLFKTAIDNFKKGSQVNVGGDYNRFPIKSLKANEILISKFFPLFNW